MSEKELAELVYGTLKVAPDFTAVVGTGNAQRFFANYAPAETKTPFVVYEIEPSEPLTKDGGTRYPVQLFLVYEPTGYLKALAFEEKILAILQDTDFEALASENRPDPDNDKFVRVINLQITTS